MTVSMARLSSQLNFFRLHLLLFIVVPLLASLVFYWLDHSRPSDVPFTPFIDALFLCVSAATVAGLFTVNLSSLAIGQQVVLALLTAVGSYSFVSTTMIVIRRHYFSKEMKRKLADRVDDIIRAREDALSDERKHASSTSIPQRRGPARSESPAAIGPPIQPAQGPHEDPPNSIAFATSPPRRDTQTEKPELRHRTGIPLHQTDTGMSVPRRGVQLRRSDTQATMKDRGYGGFPSPIALLRTLAARVVGRSHLALSRTLTGRFSIPRTQTLQSVHTPAPRAQLHTNVKIVPYLTFDTTVGKNSAFEDLSQEEREELGGVELRALNLLARAVPAYWIGVQLFGFVVLAPYMARAEFRGALTSEDGQAKPVNSTWFTLFQVLSSYANNGILVDASLVPFQTAYLLLWMMIFLILAGNTAFPCFLRLFLWIAKKCVRKNSQTYATLCFILDHPRRCFLYLFPSTQTWYLAAILVSLNVVDWILFLLLDIGNEPIQSIPPGSRIVAGLFQAVAVRCGGFQIVPLGSLAPAVQVLYVVMMYVGALPLALGVRSTNVYEDRSIALYEQDVGGDNEPVERLHPGMSKAQVWGEYMAWHLKRQLSFDLWWLALALLLICIFERGKILDPTKSGYINVFTILFEIVSAYGTVGLSLGIPGQNYSMSGQLGTASKLVLCAVMLRGRHRGLPAAIDRSVLLPDELGRQAAMEEEFRERRGVVLAALRSAGLSTGERYGEPEEARAAAGEGEDVPPGLA